MSQSETIKVVIRFKGGEQLSTQEKNNWSFNTDLSQLVMPNLDGKTKPESLKLTFDKILVDVS